MDNKEQLQEELVHQLYEFLRPHADGKVKKEWVMSDVPETYFEFKMDGETYYLGLRKEG